MILDSLMAAFRSIENPRVPLAQAADDLYDAMCGPESSAGVRVSRETALTLSAMWRGVNLVSRDVAKMPLFLFRRKSDEDRERAKDHPAYRLLRRKPNREMTAFIFWQTLVGHALMAGNGYAYIFRAGDGSAEELIPLLPDRTWPVRINRRLWYMTQINEESRTLRPEDVLHVKGFSHDGIVGYNVIGKARESVGWGLAMRKYSARFFKNGARVSGVLMTPGAMKEEAAANLLRSFNEQYASLDNAHKTLLLEEGAKYQATTVSQDDAQFLESMEFSLLDVANWLNLAPHKVGHPSRTSFASLQEENQRHLDEAIDPWAVNIEQECDDKLLTEEEKREDTHYCEFNREALIRVDFRTKVEARSKQIMSGELSPDEARAMQNRPPRGDGLGGRYWMPTNMRFADEPLGGKPKPPAGGNDEETKPVVDEEPDDEGQRKAESGKRRAAEWNVLCDAAGRVFSRLANEARRAAKRPERFCAWLDELDRERPTLVRMLAPAIGLHAAPIGADTGALADRVTAGLLASFRADLLEIAGAAKPDELAGRVDAHLLLAEAFASHTIDHLLQEPTHAP
ncbi:MAG: phage portal protein [Pirellulales bacterium]|nr:phage portal protein [Pirellulales bacterium]